MRAQYRNNGPTLVAFAALLAIAAGGATAWWNYSTAAAEAAEVTPPKPKEIILSEVGENERARITFIGENHIHVTQNDHDFDINKFAELMRLGQHNISSIVITEQEVTLFHKEGTEHPEKLQHVGIRLELQKFLPISDIQHWDEVVPNRKYALRYGEPNPSEVIQVAAEDKEPADPVRTAAKENGKETE